MFADDSSHISAAECSPFSEGLMVDRMDTSNPADSLPAGGSGMTGRHAENLDRDRAASMADEGGAAGAETELREQLAVWDDGSSATTRSWGKRLLWSALALGA